MTDCSELQQRGLLQCFLDGEIEAHDSFRVVVHLDGCGDCAREADALATLKRALRRQQHIDPDVVARLCGFAALLTRGCR
jgi:predicted anti-sigma-YlaC factor YlaD